MGACAKHRKHLNAYMDGELPERKRREVEHHLSQCPICRLEFEVLRGLSPILGSDSVPPVPAGLSARILAAAAFRQKRKEAKKRYGWAWREFLFRPWLVRGATTAALIAGLAMGAWMGGAIHQRPDSELWIALATDEHAVRNIYAFDILGAEPRGSIEAATLALLDDLR